MKFSSLKYILILCITLTLFLKVGNVLSYLSCATVDIENVSLNDDATEKEEKKIEAEYFDDYFLCYQNLKSPIQFAVKIILPKNLFTSLYYPEILTPPPSL